MFSPIGKKKILLQKRLNKESFGSSCSIGSDADGIPLDGTIGGSINSPSVRSYSPDGTVGSGGNSAGGGTPSGKRRGKANKEVTEMIASTANLQRVLIDPGLPEHMMRKILTATARYRPDKDAVMLKGFQNKHIDYERFRSYLYSLFWLQFTEEEFNAFLDYFDPQKNGVLNGYDFMIAFIRLNGIRKDREAAEHREKRERFEQQRQEEAERAELEKQKKNELVANFYFSDEVRSAALQKLSEAAFKYDPSHPSCTKPTAFMVDTMKPAVFK